MTMSETSMPLLYINLGAEMLYILEQRLIGVGVEKARTVMDKLVREWLAPATLNLYFDAGHNLMPIKVVKEAFREIALSSVMRMNESSMDKLFDLMCMGLKYQLQMLITPEHLLVMTVNHLDGVLMQFPDQPEVFELLDHAHAMVMSSYRNCHSWEFLFLRAEMLTYFQGWRIKMSILLREKKQDDDGYFIMNNHDLTVSDRTETPGAIKYFEDGILIRSSEFKANKPTNRLESEGSNDVHTDDLNLGAAGTRSTDLGSNMYRKNDEIKGVKDDTSNTNEAKLLTAIINRKADVGSDDFNLSLFENADEETEYKNEVASMNNGKVEVIDVSKGKKSLSTAVSEMKVGGTAKPKKSKGADLLDLLDEAANRPATGAPKKRATSKPKTTDTDKKGSRPASKDGVRPSSKAGAGSRPGSVERPKSKAGAAAAERPASKGAGAGSRPSSKGGGRPASGTVERARSASVKKRTPPS